VYDVVHVLDASVQEEELNVPPVFPSPQVIVPVGVVGELDVSVTVTVNVSAVPATYDAGFGVTVTDTGESELGAKEDVPELAVCPVSPV
jgi:hypothetical protein